MKAFTKIVLMLLLVCVTIFTYAQKGLEGRKPIYLQLGTSGGYSPNLSHFFLIPQIGINASFGKIGIRANGELFKTLPEFDINGYLDPIRSAITISKLREKNSTVSLGVSPYFNVEKKNILFQPGIGIKFLFQNGATATVVHTQTPGAKILNYPDGDANRNLMIVEPNIRFVINKAKQNMRFFFEVGYSIPVGNNEYSYVASDLGGVVDPIKGVNESALLNSKKLTYTEKSIHSFANIGAGIEIGLFPGINNSKTKIRESFLPYSPINDHTKQVDKGSEDDKVYLYSYSWVRNCPDPPGGQEYFSYVVDGQYTYIKYEGCTGGYHEWFYTTYHQNELPVIAGNNYNLNHAFEQLVKTNLDIRTNSNISIKEFEKLIEQAFILFVKNLEMNGTKGIVSKFKIDKKIGVIVNISSGDSLMPTTENVNDSLMAFGCRHYIQNYTIKKGNCLEEYSVYTWVCPTGTNQWIINWGCPETSSSQTNRFIYTINENNTIIYPILINDIRVNLDSQIKNEDLKFIGSIFESKEQKYKNTQSKADILNILCEATSEVMSYFSDRFIKYTFDLNNFNQTTDNLDFSNIGKLPVNELNNYLVSISTHPSVNHYYINDDGIKRVAFETFTSVNNYGINDDGIKRVGEPVPGAEIYIELEPDDENIARIISNSYGEFCFDATSITNFPNNGTLILSITPSKDFKKGLFINLKNEKIRVRFITPKDKIFKFKLYWMPENIASPAENKGAFAVSGKNST